MYTKGKVLSLGSSRPEIDEMAWIAPGAVVVGDVSIGAESSIWFNCVVRADTNAIAIGCRSNIQDGTIIHVDPGPHTTMIGDDVTIGHGSIIHGARIMDGALVGMGATVLNGAVVESGGMLAAGAVLTSGKRIGEGELWAGAPARMVRMLRDDERLDMQRNAVHYMENARRFRTDLEELG